MVSSMTGFGRGEVMREKHRITVEMKSVNNRYLDLGLKMPKMFNILEADIRTELKKFVKRGKVDVFITCEDLNGSDTRIQYNKDVAEQYMRCLESLASDFGLKNDVGLSRMASLPDVITQEVGEIDENIFWPPLKDAIDQAGEQFSNARQREGEFLKNDLEKKLDKMLEDVNFITERSPMIVEEYKTNLRQKIDDLIHDIQVDENRLAMEVALFADKICVDEELVRLRSHIEATRKALENGDSENGVGRKLDFLAQEMNREANTTLSKTSDLEVSNKAIDLKTTIEKIREQIQNLE